mgnify:CR=1 FL=1
MDHGWITHQTMLTPPYMAGVNQFMEFVLAHNNGAEDMLCPCKNFHNWIRGNIDIVICHINVTGMLRTYTRWINHAESGDIGGSSCTTNGGSGICRIIMNGPNKHRTQIERFSRAYIRCFHTNPQLLHICYQLLHKYMKILS